MECKYQKEDGSACSAQAIRDDEYCFAHSQLPSIVEKRMEAKSLGGRNGHRMMLQPAKEELVVRSPKQVVSLLERTINDVRMNRIAVNQANCIGYLCNIMTKVFEGEQMETRIAILERTVLISREKVKE